MCVSYWVCWTDLCQLWLFMYVGLYFHWTCGGQRKSTEGICCVVITKIRKKKKEGPRAFRALFKAPLELTRSSVWHHIWTLHLFIIATGCRLLYRNRFGIQFNAKSYFFKYVALDVVHTSVYIYEMKWSLFISCHKLPQVLFLANNKLPLCLVFWVVLVTGLQHWLLQSNL